MKKIFLMIIAGAMFLAYSCHDKSDDPAPVVGGKGGDYYISVFPKHHDKPIPKATIYLKYNATVFPGTDVTKYDEHNIAIIEPGYDPHAHFDNLKLGNYYLYGVGYDSTISMNVTGGIPIVITSKNAMNTDINLPVTE